MTNAENKFYPLTTEQLEELKNIEAERFVVTEKSIENIRRILPIGEVDNPTLIDLRNSVVFHLSNELKENPPEDEFEETMDLMTRISMITTVIDSEKSKRGMPV